MNSITKLTRKGWFVLYVKYKHEKRIHSILQEKGIESFLPLVKTVKQWSDRKKKIIVPLFPSYLFVKLKGQKDFETVLTVKESCFFLKQGNDYAKAQDREIKNIKILLGSDHVDNIKTENRFKVSDTCIIDFGPLQGLSCEVIKISKESQVRVLIHSIRQSIIATIPTSYLSDSI